MVQLLTPRNFGTLARARSMDQVDALAARIADLRGGGRAHGLFDVRCFRRGVLAWRETFPNLMPDEPCNILLQSTWTGGTRYTAWYVGLKGTGSAAAGDVMTSHAGWSEITPYLDSVRPTWTPDAAAVSGKSTTNSASKATFNINASATVYGCVLVSDSTKGGTTGKIGSVGDFSASRAVLSGDVLLVQVTETMATA